MEETNAVGKASAEPEKAIVEPANEPEDTFVEDAKKAAAEIKAGLAERAKLLEREEKLVARQEALRSLGGGSLAGQRPIAETEDQKWAREAKVRYAGTGMDPT